MQEDKHTKIRLRELLKKEHPFRYLFFEEFGYFPIIAISALSYIIICLKIGNVPSGKYFVRSLILLVALTYEFICSKKRWKQIYCLSLDLDCEIYPDEQKVVIERIKREIKKERNRSIKRIFLGVVLAVILFIIALTMFK